ncbi:hypothetical protein K4F52_000005 [Lecanicillium sp. MT-2017a]|nr:hypothetical protein K4F52_000005 [Lecanicillium sp. MT-2017a]
MLDENLPTYRFQPSSDNPLHTFLYYTHNGSEPSAEYLVKRPPLADSKNQYALGLLDVHYSSVIYGEVLVKPEWTQSSLSSAELRAQNGVSAVIPLTPETFSIFLYNPDQSVTVKRLQSSFKSDSWEFEIPEHTFKQPSSSQIDQDNGTTKISELTPKVLFRWKKDSRLGKDMTCYMTGRSFGGKKSKEPDITVAMWRAGKHESQVAIYEPNMARVEIEDRKGLEVALLLSAEVIKDLYIMPKQNPFNTSGGPVSVASGDSPRPMASPSPQGQSPVYASGALGVGGSVGNTPPSNRPMSMPPPPRRDARQQAEIDAETKRLQAMVAEEERNKRDRTRRDEEEQKRIKKMLEQEDQERRRRQAEVDRETERLRQQYGVSGQTPSLPPRPVMSGANGGGRGWFGPATGQSVPPRPNSAGPHGYGARPPSFSPPPQGPQGSQGQGHGKAYKLGNALGTFLQGHKDKDDKDGKVKKKRSGHF